MKASTIDWVKQGRILQLNLLLDIQQCLVVFLSLQFCHKNCNFLALAKVNCFRFPRASLAAATEAPAAEDAATSSPLQQRAPRWDRTGWSVFSAEAVQRPWCATGGDFGHIWGPCKPPVRQRWAACAQPKFLSSSHTTA